MPIDPPDWSGADRGNPPLMPPPAYQPRFDAQPGYGWHSPVVPPPGAYPPYAPVGKRAPRKYWYAIGTALIVLGVVFGVGAGVKFLDIMGKQPPSEHTFGSGESTTLHMNAGGTNVVFIANADTGARHRVHCDVTPGVGVAMTNYTGDMTVNQWKAYFTITASRSGDYTVSCTGSSSDKFGVGGDLRMGEFVGAFLAGLGGLALMAVGVLTLVLTAVLRRRRARQ
ncbi:hypothetical protein MFM001_16850 [Mycobacterium sp. MFM001]|nr:hypothetical protein MFM001_16850 [Mycobacterium sp. MFM001]